MISPPRTRKDRRAQCRIKNLQFCLYLAGFGICSCFSGVQVSAAPQEVVPVDGPAFQGELVSIDASGRVSFRVAETKEKNSQARTLPLGDLVRWGNPRAPLPQTIVVLAGGGQIVTAADWAGGAAVKLAGMEVVLLSDTWNEVRLPRDLVRGIVFAQASRADDREKLAERVRNESSSKPSQPEKQNASVDVVLLTNGDRLTGKLIELERGSLSIETAGGIARLPLSRVEAIGFATSRQPSAISRQHKGLDGLAPGPSLTGTTTFAVGLRDGSLMYGKSIRASEKHIEIEMAGGVSLKGGDVGDIVVIQSLGGRFLYLSDLESGDYRHVPYLAISWPYMRDRNVLGEPIEVLGKRYLKGIGMHSASRLTYRFDGAYQRFDAAVAIDDSAKGRGSVTFGAYLLRDGKWVEAYKSGIVRGGDAPLPVSIDLRGARGLTLTVDYADRGDELDHAVWLDARLVR